MNHCSMEETVLNDEPVIEEIELAADLHTLLIRPDQYLHICNNEKCISNLLVEKERCPFCGEEIHKVNKIKIDEGLFK